jgi:lactate dehydrogenase-like 2-hydroxyacid dehydrogenase
VRTERSLIARLPSLRIISNYGVGYDSIDLPEAGRRRIVVTNTPDVLTEEVADTTIGLLLMTVRELSRAESWLRAGQWAATGVDYPYTPSLRDRSIGLVGYGRIGKAIGRRLEAFGIPLSYYGRKPQPDVPYPFYNDLVAMAEDVDTLIAILPGGPATQNLIDARVLEALGPNGVFINMARGSVVDEAALKTALRNGTILAAGLDVFMNEPRIDTDLFTIPNLTLLPHVGSASLHTRTMMGNLTMDNLMAYKQRKPPLTPVPETPFKGW